MTWDEVHRRCPEGVVPACHNSKDTVTVSGPVEVVAEFVSQLQKEGVFSKAVNCNGVAAHSRDMLLVAAAFRTRLQQVRFTFILQVLDMCFRNYILHSGP